MTGPGHKTLLKDLQEQGYAKIPSFLSVQQLGSRSGRNNFEGNLTERIYTLVARDRVFQDIAQDQRIMALCDEVFMPNYLLTASQAIVIRPGETPQP